MPNNLNKLTAIHFKKVGRVVLVPGSAKGILFGVFMHDAVSRILYAFVAGDDVLYVGYTERTLKRRMQGYTGRGNDGTDAKCHDEAKTLLRAGTEINIYALPNEDNDVRGEFRIDTAAGLEKSIIHRLQPPWNKHGKGKR